MGRQERPKVCPANALRTGTRSLASPVPLAPTVRAPPPATLTTLIPLVSLEAPPPPTLHARISAPATLQAHPLTCDSSRRSSMSSSTSSWATLSIVSNTLCCWPACCHTLCRKGGGTRGVDAQQEDGYTAQPPPKKKCLSPAKVHRYRRHVVLGEGSA